MGSGTKGAGTAWKGEDRPRKAESAFRWYGKEAWAVNLHDPSNTLLNEVGGRIFELLDGRHSIDEIVQILSREFDVESDDARQDLLEFLDQLRANEMLA